MAVPKKRQTRSRRDMRRFSSAYKLQASNTIRCSNCGAHSLSHRVCGECGQYNGKQIVAAKTSEE